MFLKKKKNKQKQKKKRAKRQIKQKAGLGERYGREVTKTSIKVTERGYDKLPTKEKL